MNLIEELSALQSARGHLSDEDLRALAERLAVPLHEVEAVSSFYPHFRRTPPPTLQIGVCRDLSCFLRDGGMAARELARECEGRADASVVEISCPGQCQAAPACLVNGVPGSPDDARRALAGEAIRHPTVAEPDPSWACDPYAKPEDRYGELRKLVEAGDFAPAIERITESGLRGMGGAGFPTGRKWQLVRDEPADVKYVVCNADESEPGAFKDRVILETLPHLVIEGIVTAGLTVGAERGFVYIRHEYEASREILEAAIQDARARGVLGDDIFGSGRRFELTVFVSPGGYILGEETALLEALEGRRGEPRNKPPYPGTIGLHGRPTLLNNVETLAHVPRALQTGRADLKFFSISGDVAHPGVVEAPLGTPLPELIERVGGMRDGRALLAFLPGGASSGFLGPDHAEVAMGWDTLRNAGSALGAGAIVIVAEGADLLSLGRNLTAFFRNESCGKCVPCRLGTEQAVRLLDDGSPAALDQLPALDETLRETSICGLGQVALTPVLSVLEHLPTASERGDT